MHWLEHRSYTDCLIQRLLDLCRDTLNMTWDGDFLHDKATSSKNNLLCEFGFCDIFYAWSAELTQNAHSRSFSCPKRLETGNTVVKIPWVIQNS
jgi:hypothetical protein